MRVYIIVHIMYGYTVHIYITHTHTYPRFPFIKI